MKKEYAAFEMWDGGPWKVVSGTKHSDPSVLERINVKTEKEAMAAWVEKQPYEFIAHDFAGWMERQGRFTHCPSGNTCLCPSDSNQDKWDKKQLEFFRLYPGVKVYKCPGAYVMNEEKYMGTTDEIIARLEARLGVTNEASVQSTEGV